MGVCNEFCFQYKHAPFPRRAPRTLCITGKRRDPGFVLTVLTAVATNASSRCSCIQQARRRPCGCVLTAKSPCRCRHSSVLRTPNIKLLTRFIYWSVASCCAYSWVQLLIIKLRLPCDVISVNPPSSTSVSTLSYL